MPGKPIQIDDDLQAAVLSILDVWTTHLAMRVRLTIGMAVPGLPDESRQYWGEAISSTCAEEARAFRSLLEGTDPVQRAIVRKVVRQQDAGARDTDPDPVRALGAMIGLWAGGLERKLYATTTAAGPALKPVSLEAWKRRVRGIFPAEMQTLGELIFETLPQGKPSDAEIAAAIMSIPESALPTAAATPVRLGNINETPELAALLDRLATGAPPAARKPRL